MTCAESEVLLHALLDGELDAGHAREVETHLETCPRCARHLVAYRELQQAMPAAQLRFTAPMSLRRRIETMLRQVLPDGYRFDVDPDAVAHAVLGKSTWAVLALTLDIELFTQLHYREAINPDDEDM